MTHDEFAIARAKKGSDIKPSRFRKSAWRMNHDAGSAGDMAASRRSLRAFKHRWRDGRHGNLDRHKIQLWRQLLSRVYLPVDEPLASTSLNRLYEPSITPKPVTPHLYTFRGGRNGRGRMVFAELAEVEKRFEALEIETLRTSYIKSKPIYEDRARLIKQISSFWPTVLQSDHVPAAIESSIQSCDLQILSSLKAIDVTRFGVDDDPEHGDPRNFKIVFEFDSGIFLEDKVLEKRFWYRRSKDGWAGLVSEPVRIKWKLNADPTLGLLDIAVDAYEEQLKENGTISISQGIKNYRTEPSYDGAGAHSRLMNALEDTDAPSISFFAFFGYRGRNVTAEESAEAMMDQSPSRGNGSGNVVSEVKRSLSEGSLKSLIQNSTPLDSDDEDPLAHEIFPAGEEVANALCEDVFPSALRYFAQASEQEAWQPGSESDLESGDVEDSDGHESNNSLEAEERPRKRQR